MAAPVEAKGLVVYVDGRTFSVASPTLSGAQLKGLAHKDAIYQLFMEAGGSEPDRLILDHEAVALREGLQFYTVPPAMAGLHGPS